MSTSQKIEQDIADLQNRVSAMEIAMRYIGRPIGSPGSITESVSVKVTQQERNAIVNGNVTASFNPITQEVKLSNVPVQPVNRAAQQLVSGEIVPADRSHTEIKPNGQQKDYVVLTPEERAKGFVRPVYRKYTHYSCGAVTSMSKYIAETYARDPWFYDGTFCVLCQSHFPLKEFGWPDGEGMDPNKWTLKEKKRVFELKNPGSEYPIHE